nr:hypothetical protein [Halochromatium glycolicum]
MIRTPRSRQILEIGGSSVWISPGGTITDAGDESHTHEVLAKPLELVDPVILDRQLVAGSGRLRRQRAAGSAPRQRLHRRFEIDELLACALSDVLIDLLPFLDRILRDAFGQPFAQCLRLRQRGQRLDLVAPFAIDVSSALECLPHLLLSAGDDLSDAVDQGLPLLAALAPVAVEPALALGHVALHSDALLLGFGEQVGHARLQCLTGALVVLASGQYGGGHAAQASHAEQEGLELSGKLPMPTQDLIVLVPGLGGLHQQRARDRPHARVRELVAELLAQHLLVARLHLLPSLPGETVDPRLDEQDVGGDVENGADGLQVALAEGLAGGEHIDHRIRLREEALRDQAVCGVEGAQPRRVEHADPVRQEAHRHIDLDPADDLIQAWGAFLIGQYLRAVVLELGRGDLLDRVVLEADAVILLRRLVDQEHLARRDIDVGRQQRPADQGVDEAALTALGLADDEDAIAVLLQPFAQARQGLGWCRQVAGRPLGTEVLDGVQAVLAQVLELLR